MNGQDVGRSVTFILYMISPDHVRHDNVNALKTKEFLFFDTVCKKFFELFHFPYLTLSGGVVIKILFGGRVH